MGIVEQLTRAQRRNKEYIEARAYEDKYLRARKGAPKWSGISRRIAKKGGHAKIGPGFRILDTNNKVIVWGRDRT